MSFARFLSSYRNRLSRILGVTSCALSLVGVAVVGCDSFPSTVALAEDNVNGYVSVSGDYFDLHMYGDTTFMLSTEEWSFYNILGMGTSNTSNYDFSVGNYYLYGGNVRFGFDTVVLDNVSLNFSFYTSDADFSVTNAQVYLQVYCTKQGLETKYVIANGVFYPSHPDYQPNAGQNIVGHFEYVNGFEGTFTIKEDTSKVLNDTNIRFLTTMWTDFTLGEMPSYLNGSISDSHVIYPLVSVNDVSATNYRWRAVEFANPDLNTYVSADAFDFGMVLFPFQAKYVLEDDEWSLDTVWFIEIVADIDDLIVNDWFYSLPFAVEYDWVNARFALFGNPNFCPGSTIDGSYSYFVSMTDSVESTSHGILSFFVPSSAPYRTFGYNVSIYNLDKYLKSICVDAYWTAYWAGWNNGRVSLANAVLSGSAYDQGYKDGQKVGFSEGYSKGQRDKTSTVFSLFGAVVSVPIDIFNGLTPLVIWDTPIISIILTFLFIGVFLFIIKRFI